MKKTKLAQVDWIDACSSGRWEEDKESEKRSLGRIRTVGYILHRDKQRIILAQSKDSAESNSDRILIPTSCVKRLRYLKER